MVAAVIILFAMRIGYAGWAATCKDFSPNHRFGGNVPILDDRVHIIPSRCRR